jgi:hypothetical protein
MDYVIFAHVTMGEIHAHRRPHPPANPSAILVEEPFTHGERNALSAPPADTMAFTPATRNGRRPSDDAIDPQLPSVTAWIHLQ